MNSILGTLLTLLILYLIVFCIVFVVSLYYIFGKANIVPNKAFIPGVNLYYFMKICNLSWWWILVPIINFLIFFFCPILIAYHFGQKRFIGIIGVFFPIPFYLFIAFSKKVKYIHKMMPDLNIKSIEDIDFLEKKIINKVAEVSSDQLDDIIINDSSVLSRQRSEIDDFIQNIDSTYANLSSEDVLVEDISFVNNDLEKSNTPKDDTLREDVFEILDDEVDNVSLENIESLEKNSINNNTTEKFDSSEYKELKEETQKVEDIAFNGVKTNSTVNQSKELTCPNCGSSLIGYHDFCPGCNMDIKHLTKEH